MSYTTAFFINIVTASINVGVYAYWDNPLNLAVAMFSGGCALLNIGQHIAHTIRLAQLESYRMRGLWQ